MPWVRLDDQFPDHPKVVAAGPLAGWLFVCGLAYCARQLTDGFIPSAQVARLVSESAASKLTASLVKAGLWEETEGGYVVHDYLEYNPSKEKTLAKRAVRADAGRRGGKQKASNLLASCQDDATTMSVAKSYPVPQPRPVPHEAATQEQDLHVSREATPAVQESPLERVRTLARSQSTSPIGSPQAAISASLASALACDEPSTPSERRKWAGAITEMVNAQPSVVPDEVPRLVEAFRDRFTVPCTPQGLVNQLAQLRADQPPARLNGHAKPARESPMEEARRRIQERREAAG
jgi:hypothetical protein